MRYMLDEKTNQQQGSMPTDTKPGCAIEKLSTQARPLQNFPKASIIGSFKYIFILRMHAQLAWKALNALYVYPIKGRLISAFCSSGIARAWARWMALVSS
jgi:hypothetical protein